MTYQDAPYRQINRRKSRQIMVGSVPVGGDAPITVQTMTNSLTQDVAGTLAQINLAVAAGADLVRVSCPDQDSTAALKTLVKESPVPLIADIHFHYLRAIEAAEAGAACLRINPGNIGSHQRVKDVVQAAKDHGAAMRIGVNAGSLERSLLEKYGEPTPEAMTESALNQAGLLLDLGFTNFKISVKASDIFLAASAYRLLAAACDHPLHIGVTEAGTRRSGTVKSALGLGTLLWDGIGDTLRVSLSAPVDEEVRVGFEILKALGLRNHGVTVISCPSCARQQFDVLTVARQLEERLAHIQQPITLSVIGCVVNGPGEARQSDVGLTGGGKGTHQVYIRGSASHRLKNADLVEQIAALVEEQASSQEISETV